MQKLHSVIDISLRTLRNVEENNINANQALSPHPNCIASIFFPPHEQHSRIVNDDSDSPRHQRVAALFLPRTLVMLQRQHQLPLQERLKIRNRKASHSWVEKVGINWWQWPWRKQRVLDSHGLQDTSQVYSLHATSGSFVPLNKACEILFLGRNRRRLEESGSMVEMERPGTVVDGSNPHCPLLKGARQAKRVKKQWQLYLSHQTAGQK